MTERRTPDVATEGEMAAFRRALAELIAIASERRAKMAAVERRRDRGSAA